MPNTDTQQQEQQKEVQQRSKAIPRFAGVISGLLSGFFTAQYLLKKSLFHWVNERSMTSTFFTEVPDDLDPKKMKKIPVKVPVDPFVKAARDEVKADDNIIKRTTEALKKIRATYEKKLEGTANIKNAEKKAKEITRVAANRDYYIKRALQDIENPEIIKRMGLGLRQSVHKKWIFAGSMVALGAVGYAAYKITDRLLNGPKGQTHTQRIEQQQAARVTAPASGIAIP